MGPARISSLVAGRPESKCCSAEPLWILASEYKESEDEWILLHKLKSGTKHRNTMKICHEDLGPPIITLKGNILNVNGISIGLQILQRQAFFECWTCYLHWFWLSLIRVNDSSNISRFAGCGPRECRQANMADIDFPIPWRETSAIFERANLEYQWDIHWFADSYTIWKPRCWSGWDHAACVSGKVGFGKNVLL